MRIILTLALVAAALTAATVSALAADAADNHVVKLHAQNGSHEYGTVALKAQGSATVVEVHVINAPADVMQPVHIHVGTCSQLNPTPKYPLTPVHAGTSTTTVNVSLSSLLQAPMAVNVHKSANDIKDYVACADIK